jgi:hypothetical protein
LEVMDVGILLDGKPASISFVFTLESDPTVAELKRYEATVHGAWLIELVDRFNNLAYDVRQDHIARHEKIVATPGAEWTPGDLAHEKAWFPAGVHADHKLAMLVLKPAN